MNGKLVSFSGPNRPANRVQPGYSDLNRAKTKIISCEEIAAKKHTRRKSPHLFQPGSAPLAPFNLSAEL